MPRASPDHNALAAGLTSKQAEELLVEFGPNSVTSENEPRWRTFTGKFWSPIPWLLEFAIVLQIALGRHLEAGLIASLLLFNASLSFVQEGRAAAALAALRKRLAPTALVRRDGAWTPNKGRKNQEIDLIDQLNRCPKTKDRRVQRVASHVTCAGGLCRSGAGQVRAVPPGLLMVAKFSCRYDADVENGSGR
jgi:hypothetical protein